MARVTKSEREESLEKLREWIAPGDTLYTVLRHRSASGMSRAIDVYGFTFDEREPQRKNMRVSKSWYSFHIARALGYRFDEKREAVTVGGAGMDMGFHLIYELSSALFRDGFECIGEACPSNDHTNGDRDYTPHHHKDGGYSLRHEWIG